MTNLIIRLGGLDDTKAILNIYSRFIADTTATFEETIPTLEEYRERMRPIFEQYPCLICEESGRVIAYAYAHRHQQREAYRFSAELSIYLRPPYSGLGIGTAMYDALVELLRCQNVLTAYAAVSSPNPASAALHQRLGFHEAGVWKNAGYKLGQWRDVVWYEKSLGDYSERPNALIPVGRLSPDVVAGILSRANSRLVR